MPVPSKQGKSEESQRPSQLTRNQADPIHLYVSRQPYRLAAGRACEKPPVEDRLADALAMVALDQDQPSASSFYRILRRELKIRGYAQRTIASYGSAVRSLLRWFGRPPHLLHREHVKNYLEYLYDGGHSSSSIAVQLVAIRDTWDKLCFRDVTLGLATPRRKRKRIVVVSREEVRRLLQAAPSLRDTLLIGLMYGTGMRVSEVSRLRWRDIDLDRNQIFIWQGKGNADRHVQLPGQYREILTRLGDGCRGESYLFPSQSNARDGSRRHLSPRTVQRVVRLACQLAGVKKRVTPHSLRHAFATHSFEDGCDIRRIQTVLGHVRLETTTIYVTVAKQRTDFPSPLDRLALDSPNACQQSETTNPSGRSGPTASQPSAPPSACENPVGRMRLHSRRDPRISDEEFKQTRRTQITIELTGHGRRDFLLGTIAEMPRPGLVTITLPPIEQWQSVIKTLPQSMQKRMIEPAFYQTLQAAITQRMTCSVPPDH